MWPIQMSLSAGLATPSSVSRTLATGGGDRHTPSLPDVPGSFTVVS